MGGCAGHGAAGAAVTTIKKPPVWRSRTRPGANLKAGSKAVLPSRDTLANGPSPMSRQREFQ